MHWVVVLGLLGGCGFHGPRLRGDATPGGDDAMEAGVIGGEAGIDGPNLQGLVAWYQAETIPPAVDSTGNGHTGVCTSCPTLGLAKRGQASFRFDGMQNRIDVVSTAALEPTVFTIAAWTSWAAFPGNNAYACPVGKYVGTGFANSWQFCLHGTNSGGGVEWMFLSQHDAFDQMKHPATIALNTWHHVAATWDGSTKRMYVDGSALATTAMPAGPIQYDNGRVTLGADLTSSTVQDSQFEGLLDDVRIYNRVLAATEIVQLAQ